LERCGEVKILLGLLAMFILIVYSMYFVKIIRGNPQEFELDLSHALQNWLQESKPKSLWVLLGVSLLFEMVYFGLVFLVISNPVTLALTLLIIAVEVWHLAKVLRALRAFFAGTIASTGIFDWKVERVSAMGFFSHSLIVLLTLIFVG
jgi:hypothetical protein